MSYLRRDEDTVRSPWQPATPVVDQTPNKIDEELESAIQNYLQESQASGSDNNIAREFNEQLIKLNPSLSFDEIIKYGKETNQGSTPYWELTAAYVALSVSTDPNKIVERLKRASRDARMASYGETSVNPEDYLFPVANDRNITVVSPDYSDVEVDGFGLSRSVATVQVNTVTGDLRWELPAGYEFVSLTPILEKPFKNDSGQWEGQYRFGFSMKEIDVEKNESVTNVLLYYDRSEERKGWYAQVTCQTTGDTATYKFGDPPNPNIPLIRKPVFYAYSPTPMMAEFKLDFNGNVVTEYPLRENGSWKFNVGPDGSLTTSDGTQYPYCFWEGLPTKAYSHEFSEGFCVAGSEVISFLEKNLTELGLNQKEKTDFITYWLPVMQKNKYNLVRFMNTEYTDIAKFTIIPTPDSLIRVFMAFKSVSEMTNLPAQTFEPISRNGFTVVEWGGVNLDE